ncbi:bacitracin ABC transporter permease [Paenibacillus sp. IHB B 3415]|uniref:FtsX-like permease family protein n=1 Tax=Paenibacillus sp. IHB B 3415 TaxID=867080 RepID=UPI0005735E59|nr:ABC transporter permease [Paenibacillus sp. IHB B 3415]KHL96883.1 bacitracin ABC transporter permease [Paenibacillus sp. IHB B 3415]
MSLNYIILRNLKKNIKNYYLYVFALIFSVALYFSFVTLQFDPAMDEVGASIKGGAAIGASSVLLIAIVAIFLLYANTIFIKRRSKEIGLFQLIGLTKGKIFTLLSAENLILYFGSMFIGIGAGFVMSRLVLMILFKILAIQNLAKLRFSPEALVRTILVFAAVYVLIMIMNYTFIKAQSILSLFKATSTTQQRIRKMPLWEIVMGLLGIACIGGGYYISSQLFGGKYTDMTELMIAMIVILALVIIGTYLFYKGSVSFIFNMIRKSKKGYLSINEVLSLSSIMFRMKSNALLLTIITTVSALAIGLLSLSYISYYSVETSARESSPHDFGFIRQEAEAKFLQALDKEKIGYEVLEIPSIAVYLNVGDIIERYNFKEDALTNITTTVISDSSLKGMDLRPGEVLMTGYNNTLKSMVTFKDSGEIGFITKDSTITQQLTGLSDKSVLPYYYGAGLMGVAVVDDTVFKELVKHKDLKAQKKTSDSDLYYGINLTDQSQAKQAYEIYLDQKPEFPSFSQYEFELNQRTSMGLIMFIVGFLGLTFLITSGCILYFKQMDEGEEEKDGYTILRKLGFTQGDLLRGIQFKQLFNFGIPLVVGLCHSYFAVKSGWFLFGTEMLTPMFVVMAVYTVLYSIFGLLSVLYYKRVIRESL